MGLEAENSIATILAVYPHIRIRVAPIETRSGWAKYQLLVRYVLPLAEVVAALGRRADGYHELSSLVAFAELGAVVQHVVGDDHGLDARIEIERDANGLLQSNIAKLLPTDQVNLTDEASRIVERDLDVALERRARVQDHAHRAQPRAGENTTLGVIAVATDQ